MHIDYQMADRTIFEESLDTAHPESPMLKKEVVYVLDQTQGNYQSAQSILDLSVLSNSGKYVSWSSAYLEVPLVMYLKCNSTTLTGFQALNCPYAMSLKNGPNQIIHSLSVDYNGSSVIQTSPYLPAINSFQAMTSWSRSDIDKHSDGIYFAPDDPLSSSFNAAAANLGTGNGFCVNTNGSTNATPDLSTAGYKSSPCNTGFYKRCQKSAYDINTATNFPLANTAGTLATIGKDYFADSGVFNDAAGACKVWYVLQRIRLKDICSLFGELPLTKNAYLKLTLNLNQGTVNFTTTSNATPNACNNMVITSSSSQNGSIPFMIAQMTGQNGGRSIANLFAASSTYTWSAGVGVGSVTVGGNVLRNPLMSQIRLVAPLFTMLPEAETLYIQRPIKPVKYWDFYSFSVTGIAAGSTFNQLVSNGISNIDKVLVIPYLSSSVTQQAGITPILSPFDAAPAMPHPIPLTQFQVQIGGVNLLMQNSTYDYEQFVNELQSTNAINEAQTTGLTSGLITELLFQHGYRYYVINASRRAGGEDGVPRSVQISGVNSSQYAIDLMVFVTFGRQIALDVETSKLQ